MTLSKRFMMGTLSVALAFGFLLAGCGGGDDNPSPPPPSVDKSALEAGISAAESAKAGVLAGTQATVAAGARYVSATEMQTFESAINAAKDVKNNGSASQADVNAATQTLNAAVGAFTAAIKTDGTKTTGFTEDDLNALIETANAAKAGVEISADGTDQPASKRWVTQAVKDAFDAAITAAEGATDADRDAKYTALVDAINTFNEAKQPGSKAKTVTITGLPADYNGAELYVYLSQSATLTGVYVSTGDGTVQNGSLTVSLANASDGGPWSGAGSWYVVLRRGYYTFHITSGAKSFSGDSVPLAFSEFQTPEIEAASHITGSVTFTNVPTTRPPVKIWAEYYSNAQEWGAVDLLGVAYAVADDGSFSIPFTQKCRDDMQAGGELYFTLLVGSGENQYRINLPSKPVVAGGLAGDLNVSNLGEATLASTTLSGVLTARDGGQPVPYVYIRANNSSGNRLGGVALSSPAVNGQAWSMTIPVLEGEAVSFYVYVFDSPNEDNLLFSKDFSPAKTASVSNQPISGIDFDLGDLSVGRMSGTVSFTNMPSPPPYQITVFATYDAGGYWPGIGGGSGSAITVNGSAGSWAIPRDDAFLAALAGGSQTVTFEVRVRFNESEDYVTFATIDKTISNAGLANINLETVNLATLTLSGTLNVTFNGQPVPRVVIEVYNAIQGGRLGYGIFNTSAYNAPWTIHIPALNSPTNLRFRVLGYSASGVSLFSADQVATVSNASTGAISNIAITYHEAWTLPSSTTLLTLDTWTEGTLSAGDPVWYQFTSDGSAYYVSWNDSYEGDGTKTADLGVSAYTSAGVPLFSADSGWTTPSAISAGQSGTIYVKVDGYGGYSSGTYAIKLSKSSAGN